MKHLVAVLSVVIAFNANAISVVAAPHISVSPHVSVAPHVTPVAPRAIVTPKPIAPTPRPVIEPVRPMTPIIIPHVSSPSKCDERKDKCK